MKKSKRTLTPKLRFPEFRDKGEWEKRRLGSLGSFTGGGTPSKGNADHWEGSNPWVSSSDIYEDNIHHINISRFISDEAIAETATKVVPANSILLVSRVGVGKLAIVRQKICTSQDFINITPAKDNLVFLAYCLVAMKEALLSLNQGMAIKGFTKEDASNLEIPLPLQLVEQQKIADCLSSLDELITAEGRKLEALKAHKRGLMQRLFPQPGETQPRLRFPEFRDGSRWKKSPISYLLKRKSNPVQVDEHTAYREIGVRSHGKGIFHKEPKSGKEIGSKRVFQIFPSALVFNIVFAWEQAVAVTSDKEDDFIASHRFPMFLPRDKRCDVRFMQRLFLTPIGGEILHVASPGGAGRNRTLSQGDMLGLEVSTPELGEQQTIADCLEALDGRIAEQTMKIDALKRHKRGLMQQLFPALEDD